jgi:sulfate adenylyltransferase subunit 1 (EFTu-like GTPase family)
MEILQRIRFATAGSVDDGKSTLIGRLLYDLDQLKTDQIEALHKDGELNLAFATDGLMEERAKGITIDVAYRYFTGHNTRFICVDAPGHEEYLKNAFTAFTQVQTVVLLVDATRSIRPQLYRHLAICELLQVPNTIICINKLDAVKNPESTYLELLAQLNLPKNAICLPISALKGDNVAFKSNSFHWYTGTTLIELIAQSKTASSKYPHIRVSGKIGNTSYGTLEGSTTLLNNGWKNANTNEALLLENLLVNGKTNWEEAKGNGLESIEIAFQSNTEAQYIIPENQLAFAFNKTIKAKCFWITGTPIQGAKYELNINQHLVTGTITSIQTDSKISGLETYFFIIELALENATVIEPYQFGSGIGTVTLTANNVVTAGGVII